MNLWALQLRRNGPIGLAVTAFVVYALVHLLAFRPALHRYQRATEALATLGGSPDPTRVQPALSPRVLALFRANAMPPDVVESQGNSGTLTAVMLESLTRLAARSGLEVVATEQGAVTQLPRAAVVRAHLKLRGRYDAFLALLDGLARSNTLYAVERFAVTRADAGRVDIDLWASRYLLKRGGGPS